MIQNIENISNEYFEWMYHLVSNDSRAKNKISYRKLLIFLNTVAFSPSMEMDYNRLIDAVDFRYKFANENGYPNLYIKNIFDSNTCSVLEMMIALSYKVEEQITDNYLYGNRTGQWFWSMITSLGLNSMDDKAFDQNYCKYVLDIFMNRDYSPNGKGGLFTLERPYRDMRTVDIWTQFMWYLEEIKET